MKKFVVIFAILLTAVSAIFAKSTLVITNRDAAAVQIIDADEMKLLATIPVGRGPHEVVVTSDGKTAIVSNYGDQTPNNFLSIIDIAAMKETKRIDILPMMRPHGLVELGGKIYFSAESNRAIGRFDLASEKVDWVMGTGQNASHMLVVTPDQKRFYTANVGSDTVTAFEFSNVPPAGSRISQIPVGKQPEAIDISPDGKEVWVGLNVENAFQIIDTTQNKAGEKISVGERPYRIRFTPDGKQVVMTIPNTKELLVLDVATRKEIRRIKLESPPLGSIFSKNGKTAFITTTQTDSVVKINLENGEILGKVETGKASDGIGLAEL